MGDVHGRRAHLLLQPLDLAAGLRAQLGVEVRERLVHEEDLGLTDERAPEGDALALPARELARLAREELADVERLRGRVDPAPDLVPRHLAHLEPEREVVADGHLRVERVVLEDHGDVATARRHVVDDVVADPDVPSGEPLEAGQQPQRGRLAGAGGADEHHELAVGNLERELVQGDDVTEVLRRAVVGHRGHPLSLSSTRRPCRG